MPISECKVGVPTTGLGPSPLKLLSASGFAVIRLTVRLWLEVPDKTPAVTIGRNANTSASVAHGIWRRHPSKQEFPSD